MIPTAIPIAKQIAPENPVVCGAFYDPVAEGTVGSLARPGGNVTGVSWQSPEASGKRVELATEIVPGLRRVAMIFADNDRGAVLDANNTSESARRLGLRLSSFPVRDASSVEGALSAILSERPQILVVVSSGLTIHYRKHLTSAATKARIPVISEDRGWVEAGALLSYGPDGADLFRRTASYVDRILKGEKAGDIPIELPRKFELVVNQNTAEALGLRIPAAILLRADAVIR